jgi:lysophospholipase L1-like esterase
MRRRLSATLSTFATLAAAVAVTAAPSQAAEDEPLRYVALGDSYSAASGVFPPDPAAPPACGRSLSNYPNVITADIGAQLTDVTCGAAETRDYFTSQHPGVPPQLEALGADTELVTMTIGGNDNSTFFGAIVKCGTAGAATLGQGSPCKDQYGDSFAHDIRTKTYPALVEALTAVNERSPHAEVAILGYPWILPPAEGCYDKMPVAEGDVPYLRDIQSLLNGVIEQAAAETGSTYVDMSQVSEGHDACKPIGVRWVEPVLQGTNPVVVHPNALGEAEMAKQTMAVLGLS